MFGAPLLEGGTKSEVFRFSAWNLISVYSALSFGLLIAIVSKAEPFFAFVFGTLALALFPWMLLSLRNRRLVIDDRGLTAYDWLGRETLRARFDEIRGIRSSADDPEQSYFQIKTIRGDIDILPLRGRAMVLDVLRERTDRIPP